MRFEFLSENIIQEMNKIKKKVSNVVAVIKIANILIITEFESLERI